MEQREPGLVALYDIRPGNGAGLFLQPRSTHGAKWLLKWREREREREIERETDRETETETDRQTDRPELPPTVRP